MTSSLSTPSIKNARRSAASSKMKLAVRELTTRAIGDLPNPTRTVALRMVALRIAEDLTFAELNDRAFHRPAWRAALGLIKRDS